MILLMLKRWFKEKFTAKTSEEFLKNQKRKMFDSSEASAFINPVWEIEVRRGNDVLIQMPFCFLVHTHLKDYGFEPDDEKKQNPTIILRLDKKGSEAKLPLFLKKLPKEME